MTQYLLYLLEAGICLSLFYLIYWLGIKNDTFHRLKRFYLLLSVVFSLLIPLLPATALTKQIENRIFPFHSDRQEYLYAQNNFEKLVLNSISNPAPVNGVLNKSDLFLLVLMILYTIGAGVMFVRLLTNLHQISTLVKKNKHKQYKKYTIISLNDDYPTFSFFRYIFLNDNNLDANDRKDVLLHEATHIRQGHSFDILSIELCKIFFWFTPAIWQIKGSISKVHECLADENLVGQKSEKIVKYQSLLLKQYLSSYKIELAHPFNYSLIKFRINMMTKSKSKWWAKYKLIFALPIIILSMAAFTNENLSSPSDVKSSQTKLNQIELFKQFAGVWRFEQNKDTIFTLECQSHDTGLNMYLKGESEGKIMIEQKGVLEYDSKSDRLILKPSEIKTPPVVMWFTSGSVCEAGEIRGDFNPIKVSTERKWVFKSADLLVLSVLVNGKYEDALVLSRIK